ncbi:MAG: C_GCAxxG_C_C family protein [Butyricicoccus pullicaecorum]|nr:C_GCAxxG_C_C family protein [Butyricicoccus pullicaecorum]
MSQSRVERALALHQKGYNCAQAVICAYADLFDIDEQTAYKMSEGFGLGMGMMEVCGALTGGLMLAGLKNSAGIDAPGATKGSTYKLNRTLGQAFQQSTGSVLCHELKGRDTGTPLCPCDVCIQHGAQLVEEYLLSQK